MKKKVVKGVMLTLLLICILTLAFNVQPAKAIMVRDDHPTLEESDPAPTSYSAAFIYSTDLASAQRYESLLEAHGVAVDLVSNSTAETWNYSSYGLIIIGSDTGSFSQWKPESAVPVINGSGKPISGLGEGGYAFFGKLGLDIGYPHGWHGNENRIYVVDATHRIFNYPISISIPPDKIIQLYNSTSHVGIYMPSPVAGVTRLGRESVDINHYPLIQEDTRYVLWGFSNSPAGMTQTGKDLFVNVVLWLLGWTAPSSTRYPWSMFHHDLKHTGYTESPAPNTNQTLWSYATGTYVFSSPAVADGRVYIGSGNGKVYCLNAFTGAHIWNYTTGSYVLSSPAVAVGRVYIGSNDKQVYCLNASTGEHIWSYTTGSYVQSSPAVADCRVYIGSSDKQVYCLNALTGEKIWNYTTGDNVFSSPAVVDGKVYAGSYDKGIYCLDASTGALIWKYITGGYVRSSPAIVDGRVYIGSDDKKVYCLDASTGAHIWNYTTGLWTSYSPAVVDGRVYIGSDDMNVYCLNASTGALIWKYITGGYVRSSPAVAVGRVYIGSNDKQVYCLNASTGEHIWSYTTGSYVQSSPAVADCMVFVGSYDCVVYAFGNITRVPEDYKTIQEAINASAPGSTIIIAPGVYHESIVINKTLTIIGLPGSAPVFSGGGSGIAVTLLSGASGSTIAGIVITNWDQGILIINSSGCKIYDNIMSLMNYNGIAVEGNTATNNLIYYNIFQNNTIAINLTASSTSNTIYKNIITLNNISLNLESNGNIIYANTIAQSQVGINMSNSNGNIIYHNNFVDNLIQVCISMSTRNIWDDGYPSGGNYWSTHSRVDLYGGPNQNQPGSDGIVDTNFTIAANNIDWYPLAQPFSAHDIGITNVITSKTIVGQGYTLRINLKILNYGMYNETFTITACANTTIIAKQTITLTRRNSTTITFTWNTVGFAKGNYTISAYAGLVPDEADTTDNILTDGWIFVGLVGDINADGIVDIEDIYSIALAYGTIPSQSEYKPNLDINDDGIIDIEDLYTAALHYGETDP